MLSYATVVHLEKLLIINYPWICFYFHSLSHQHDRTSPFGTFTQQNAEHKMTSVFIWFVRWIASDLNKRIADSGTWHRNCNNWCKFSAKKIFFFPPFHSFRIRPMYHLGSLSLTKCTHIQKKCVVHHPRLMWLDEFNNYYL